MKPLTNHGIPGWLDRIGTRNFFLLLLAYQFIFLFQGLDFADEGFHATFYEQIYNDPHSVQYNFMYWLSGIIGGAWLKLFPGLGLFGIRFAGALVTTSTAILSYRMLRGYLNTGYLKLGLLLVVLINACDPKEIFYNNISTLFYVTLAYFLFAGLKKNNLIYLFLSGAFVTLNAFTRLTNVLELSVGILIFYYGYLNRVTIGRQITQALVFGAGFLVTTGFIILIMRAIGHWDIFLSSVDQIIKLGKSKEIDPALMKSQDSSSYYGMKAQLKMFWGTYSLSLKYVFLSIAVIVALATAIFHSRSRVKWGWLFTAFKVVLFIALTGFVLTGSKLNNTPNIYILYFFTGFVIVMTLLILLTSKDNDARVLAVLGCMFTILYPIGSSSGILTSGIYSFWLSLPISIHYFFSVRSVSLRGQVNQSASGEHGVVLAVREDQLTEVKNWALYICIIACLYSAYYYPIHNASDRIYMRYGINSPKMRGIYTNPERAAAINELLAAAAPYIKPNDYVLAHDAMPMFHYLTGTRPFLGNSYPWLYQIPVFRDRLEEAVTEKKQLPVVVMQTVATNGWRGKNWPQNSTEEYSTWNADRNALIEAFLTRHQYRKVWSSHAFTILVPPAF